MSERSNAQIIAEALASAGVVHAQLRHHYAVASVAALEAEGRLTPANCNCGFGGEHLDNNPNCQANIPDSKPLSKVESTDEREALATLIRDSAAWKFGAPDELADAILARYTVTPRKEQS